MLKCYAFLIVVKKFCDISTVFSIYRRKAMVCTNNLSKTQEQGKKWNRTSKMEFLFSCCPQIPLTFNDILALLSTSWGELWLIEALWRKYVHQQIRHWFRRWLGDKQATSLIRINAGLLLIEPLGSNFSAVKKLRILKKVTAILS